MYLFLFFSFLPRFFGESMRARKEVRMMIYDLGMENGTTEGTDTKGKGGIGI